MAAHQRSGVGARSGSRRRSGGGSGSPSCGTYVRQRARVGRPRPAAQHLVLGAEEHLGVLAVGERRGSPGSRAKSEPVHSQTSPSIWCAPRTGWRAPPGGRRRAAGPTGRPARGPEVRARRGRRPRRRLSHSASVGRRAPAQRAKASASYQHTCCTGSSRRERLGAPEATARPTRRRRRARQNCGCDERRPPGATPTRLGPVARGRRSRRRRRTRRTRALVTGVVSMRNGARVTVCAGRSLS